MEGMVWNDIMTIASEYNELNIMIWLHNNIHDENVSSYKTYMNGIMNQNLDILKWLDDNRQEHKQRIHFEKYMNKAYETNNQ